MFPPETSKYNRSLGTRGAYVAVVYVGVRWN
jgi:hypothetical protein